MARSSSPTRLSGPSAFGKYPLRHYVPLWILAVVNFVLIMVYVVGGYQRYLGDDRQLNDTHVYGTFRADKNTYTGTKTAVATTGLFLSKEDSGQIIPLDPSTTDGGVVLPTAEVGLNYTFVLTVNAGALANNSFISAGPALTATQFFWGQVLVSADNAADQNNIQAVPLATETQLYLCLATDSTLTGGQGGDRIHVECIKAGSWHVSGVLTTSGTIAAAVTPMFTAQEIAA